MKGNLSLFMCHMRLSKTTLWEEIFNFSWLKRLLNNSQQDLCQALSLCTQDKHP